jgi:hypothetical protein
MAKSTVQPAQVVEEKTEDGNAQQPQIDPALIEKLLGQINTLQNRLSEIEEKSNKTGFRESEPKKFGEIGLGKKIPDYDKVEKPVTFIRMEARSTLRITFQLCLNGATLTLDVLQMEIRLSTFPRTPRGAKKR